MFMLASRVLHIMRIFADASESQWWFTKNRFTIIVNQNCLLQCFLLSVTISFNGLVFLAPATF